MRAPSVLLAATVLTAVASALPARAAAQQAVLSGGIDVAAGIEGGASGYARGVRRSRTTFRFGAEGYLDELPDNILSLGVLVEVEPVATFGADLRYLRRFAADFNVHAGFTSIIAPKNMVGGTFGMSYRLGLSDAVALSFNPLGNVYFVGADLPDDTVLWQAMLAVGVRVKLF
jgi:hypothetical protein